MDVEQGCPQYISVCPLFFRRHLLADEIVKVTPEYEDCKKIAKKFDIPLVEVMKMVSE